MNSLTKVFIVILILAGCAAPYQQAGSGGANNGVSEQPIESNTKEKTKEDRKSRNILNQAARLRSFLFLYCRAYESKDLDKFSAFFTPDATENDRPFHEFFPRYRRNFERIEHFKYRIDLNSYSLDPDTGHIKLKGNYFINYFLKDGTWKENNGIISMELIQNGGSYLVKRLNYSFLSLD